MVISRRLKTQSMTRAGATCNRCGEYTLLPSIPGFDTSCKDCGVILINRGEEPQV